MDDREYILRKLSLEQQVFRNRDAIGRELSADEVFIEVSRQQYRSMVDLLIHYLREDLTKTPLQ